jgi:hypothetical protein
MPFWSDRMNSRSFRCSSRSRSYCNELASHPSNHPPLESIDHTRANHYSPQEDSLEKLGYGFGSVKHMLYMRQQLAPAPYKTAHYAFATAIMGSSADVKIIQAMFSSVFKTILLLPQQTRPIKHNSLSWQLYDPDLPQLRCALLPSSFVGNSVNPSYVCARHCSTVEASRTSSTTAPSWRSRSRRHWSRMPRDAGGSSSHE